jgi:hypothetical protein
VIRDPERHTPIQRFRLAADLWEEFGEAAGPRGRSAVLGQLIRWYLRKGPTPKRPDAAARRAADVEPAE